MLQQTGASIIVCPSSLVGQVVAVSASCPALRRIVVMDLTLVRYSQVGCVGGADRQAFAMTTPFYCRREMIWIGKRVALDAVESK